MPKGHVKGPRCGAKSRQTGLPCKLSAGYGTDHLGFGRCKFHGGNMRSGRVQAANQIAAQLGGELNVEPHEALLIAVRRAAMVEQFWAEKISTLEDDEMIVKWRRIRKQADAGGSGGGFEEQSSKAYPHPSIEMHERALRELAHIAKIAIDAGIDERRVQLAEGWAARFAPVFDAIFHDRELALTAEQLDRAAPIVRRHLLALEGGVGA